MARYALTPAATIARAHPGLFKAPLDPHRVLRGDAVMLDNVGVRGRVRVTLANPQGTFFVGVPDEPAAFGGAEVVFFDEGHVLAWELAPERRPDETWRWLVFTAAALVLSGALSE